MLFCGGGGLLCVREERGFVSAASRRNFFASSHRTAFCLSRSIPHLPCGGASLPTTPNSPVAACQNMRRSAIFGWPGVIRICTRTSLVSRGIVRIAPTNTSLVGQGIVRIELTATSPAMRDTGRIAPKHLSIGAMPSLKTKKTNALTNKILYPRRNHNASGGFILC